MSVKTTIKITRKEAEERWLELEIGFRRIYVAKLSDRELESHLDWLAEEVNGGEGFKKYWIVEKE